MKNILVQFDIKAGEYEHRDFYLFKTFYIVSVTECNMIWPFDITIGDFEGYLIYIICTAI